MGIRQRWQGAVAGWRAAGVLDGVNKAGTTVHVSNATIDPPTISPRRWANYFMGPGMPITPLFPSTDLRSQTAEVEPRSFQYVPAINATISPRVAYGLMSFPELRRIGEAVPEVAMCRRIITEEMKALTPKVIRPDGQEADLPELRWMTEAPDGFTPWPVWLSRFLYNVLIYDALGLYRLRKDRRITGMRIIDGSTIMPLIDERGEQPADPAPAFTQIIWGTPKLWINTQQLWYQPRQLRADAPYGLTSIEDALTPIQLLEKLWSYQLDWYEEGNMPEMMIPAPQNWSPEYVLQWEEAFNDIMVGNLPARRRIRFIPSGFGTPILKQAQWSSEEYETALDRVLNSFGMTQSEIGKTPGEGLGGKGYQEAMSNLFYRMTIAPLKRYVEAPFNQALNWNGYTGYTFRLALPTDSIDPDTERQRVMDEWDKGLRRRNEARQALRLEPDSGPEGMEYSAASKGPAAAQDFWSGFGPGQKIPVAENEKIPVVDGEKIPVAVNGNNGHTAIAVNSGKKIKVVKRLAPPIQEELEEIRKQQRTDGMLFLPLDEETAKQLLAGLPALPDGAEPMKPEYMHITLIYFNELDAIELPKSAVLAALRVFASSQPALHGVIGGFGRFNGAGNRGGEQDQTALYASFDCVELPAFRQALVEAMEAAGMTWDENHGFTPHITLAFIPADAPMEEPQVPALEVSFNQVSLAWGEEGWTYVPLAGSMKMLKLFGVCAEDDHYFGAPVQRKTLIGFPKPGRNESEIVAIGWEGEDMRPALWKPEAGEDAVLQTLIGGKQSVREEAACVLDRALAVGPDHYLVPLAYVTTVDGEPGAVVHYVRRRGSSKDVRDYAPEWVERAALLDCIAGNIDRHHNNWLTHPDDPQRPILIDNGLTFAENESIVARSPFVDAMRGKPLSEEALESLYTLLGDEATWTDVTDCVGAHAAGNARRRAMEVKEAGLIPAYTVLEFNREEDPTTTPMASDSSGGL